MLGKRSEQKGLWEADRLYLDYVGKDTFYGLLASLRGQLFSDDDFAEIYCPDNGRDSVPPSLLATASSSMMSTLLSPILRPIRALSGSDQLWSVILLTAALLPQLHFRIRAFRPGF